MNKIGYQIAAIGSSIILAACGGKTAATTDTVTPAQYAQAHRVEKAAATDYQNTVQALYIAYFGRPADPHGLANFEAALNAAGAPGDVAGLAAAYGSNGAVKALIDSFGTSAESAKLYGSGNTAAFVTAVFTNVLNRAPQAAGLAFWSGQIDSGALSKGNAALSIMAGALSNTSQQGLLDAQTVNNKLNVASTFTATLSTPIEIDSYAGPTAAAAARSLLAQVDNTTDVSGFQSSIDNAIAGLNATYTQALAATHLQVIHAPFVATPPNPSISMQDVIGTYRDLTQPGSTWLAGSISLKPGTSDQLIWTNQAGVSWGLTANPTYDTLAVDPGSAHPDQGGGTAFDIDLQNGKVAGFKFLGSYLTRDGVTVPSATPYLTTYLTLDVDKSTIPAGFTYGYSMYEAIWPMIDRPLYDFGAGLVGTWLNPDNSDFTSALLPPDDPYRGAVPSAPVYRGYQTIEGSSGYWASTHFPTTQPKYRINGTPNGYADQLSAPGWEFGANAIAPGAGGAWHLPMGSAGVAQLSNTILVPPDGMTFKSDTAGELFGIAWMALPLTAATTGTNPVGNQSWTLFINSTNYQGPVAFYVPDVWEVLASSYPTASGRGLDARPGVFAGGFSMEMGQIPLFQGKDSNGVNYARIPRLSFPTDANGVSVLASDFTFYSSAAIFDAFSSWMHGGAPNSGQFALAGAVNPAVSAEAIFMWSGSGTSQLQIESSQGLGEYVVPGVSKAANGASAWTLQWKGAASTGVFPEYYQQNGAYMVPVSQASVPAETGLTAASFPFNSDAASKGVTYSSPSTWQTPAPAAGPFTAKLNDGSTVTYSWYRFVDQPALQGFGWTADQKNNLQAVVEKIHTQWKGNTSFMAPQSVGNLVTMDAALIVTPPVGMEAGYVPVVTGQLK